MGQKILDDNGNPFISYFTSFSALTPSGTTTASFTHRAIYIGGAGDLAFQTEAGGTEVVITCPAGAWLPIEVAYVNSTATTATNIVLAR